MSQPEAPRHGAGDPTVHIPGQYPPAPSGYPTGGGQYAYPPVPEPQYAAPGGHAGQAGYGEPGAYPDAPTYAAGPFPPQVVQTAPRRRGLKITLIVLAVVLVLGGAGGFAAYWYLARAVDRTYTVGKCLDTPALSPPSGTAGPAVVDCASPAARSRILAVYDGRTSADGQTLCGAVPEAVAHMQLTLSNGSTKLLCLGVVQT